MGILKNIKAFFAKIFYALIKPSPLPIGIKVILWYTGILAVFSFVVGIIVPVLYPGILEINPMIILFNVIFLAVSGLIIYGIIKRHFWAYKLTIVWYVVSIIYNFLYFFYSYDIFDIMLEILLIGLIFSFVVNCVVIWYLFSQYEYFKCRGRFLFHKNIRLKMAKANDHIFMVVFIAFWFATLVVLIFAGVRILNDTFKVSEEVTLYKKQFGIHDNSFCDNGDDKYKDICLMTLALSNKDKALCNSVVSPFYRFTCILGSG